MCNTRKERNLELPLFLLHISELFELKIHFFTFYHIDI